MRCALLVMVARSHRAGRIWRWRRCCWRRSARVPARLETWRAGTKMLGGEISTQLTGRVVAIEQMATAATG